MVQVGRNLIEWFMHFVVPQEGAKKYFPASVMVASSDIENAVEGLTTRARKNGELICEIPGF